jgi:hypothetical protein
MIPTEERGMSPLAAELARLVTLSKGKRVLVEELFNGVGRFDRGLVGDPAARNRFRGALDELDAAGRIVLPAAHSRTGWDVRVLPPIPSWVMRIDPILAAPRMKPAPRVHQEYERDAFYERTGRQRPSRTRPLLEGVEIPGDRSLGTVR